MNWSWENLHYLKISTYYIFNTNTGYGLLWVVQGTCTKFIVQSCNLLYYFIEPLHDYLLFKNDFDPIIIL